MTDKFMVVDSATRRRKEITQAQAQALLGVSGSGLAWLANVAAPGPHTLVADKITPFILAGDSQIDFVFPTSPADGQQVGILGRADSIFSSPTNGFGWGKVVLTGAGGFFQRVGSTELVTTSDTFRCGKQCLVIWKYKAADAVWFIVEERGVAQGQGDRSVICGAADTFAEGQAIYLNGNGIAAFSAKANALATAQFWGTSTRAAIAGQFVPARTHGSILIPLGLQEGGTWDEGEQIYLSATTAGFYTRVAPSTVGQFIVPVGRVLELVTGVGAVIELERGEIMELT